MKHIPLPRRRAKPPAEADMWDPSALFMGSLRSELDETPEPDTAPAAPTPSPYVQLQEAFDEVMGCYRRHEITDEQAARRLQQLRLTDHSGVQWTIGSSTGTWYQRPPGTHTWYAAEAPTVPTDQVVPAWDLLGQSGTGRRIRAGSSPLGWCTRLIPRLGVSVRL